MNATPETGPRGSRSTMLWAGLSGLLLLGGLIVYGIWNRDPPTPPGPAPPRPDDGTTQQLARPMSPEEFAELSGAAQQALALLENEKIQEAEPLWERIASHLPREPLVVRNRALGRLLAASKDKSDPTFAAAQEAAAELLTVEPESWISFWVQARLHLLDRDRQTSTEQQDERLRRAVAAWDKSAQLAPRQVTPRYELFQAVRLTNDPDLLARGRKALQEAYEIEPANIFLALDWLDAAATTQAPSFLAAVDKFRQTLRPLMPGLKRRARIDVDEYLNKVVDQAREGQWPQASIAVQRLGFVRSEDVAQSDLRRIQPSPLALLLVDLQTATLAQPLATPAAKPLNVSFVRRADEGLTGDGGRTGEGGLTDLRVLDFDLDGQLDLVALQGSRLVVYGREPASANPPVPANPPPPAQPASPAAAPLSAGPWKLLSTHEVGPGFTRLLAADLDRDSLASSPPRSGASAAPPPAGKPPANTSTPSPASRATPPEPPFYVADFDFVLYGPAGVLVLRNQLDADGQTRRLEPVVQDATLAPVGAAQAGTLADFDHDGDLDLALGTATGLRLWINRGNLTFDDVTASSTLPPATVQVANLLAVDWDRDIDADLLLADASGQTVGYMENLRHIEFRWRELESPFAGLQSAAALAVVESDGNASWDVLAAGPRGLQLLLTRTPVAGTLLPLRSQTVSETPLRGVTSLDFDNDGYVDAAAWNDKLQLFRGEPSGALTPTELLADGPTGVVACEPADLDGDGDLDLAVATGDQLSLWWNEGGNRQHWLNVLVRGLDEPLSGRVNYYALGSWIEIRRGSRYQAQLVTRPFTHFGLGATEERPEAARVMFTNGVPQNVLAPQLDQVIREAQALKGSCPYLYVWNGERYEFYTDLLWNAPLGLQIADGVLLRDRPWEYLKIDGDQFQPQDGVYRLQITEELWEAGYFDQVELIAVDHPATTEIYTNEKVGPAELAEPRVHTVTRRHPPVTARDGFGRDVAPQIARRDGQFAQCYDRTLCQGLAEPHFLELDLGRLAQPQRITLFLTGWIYPTDTSLNISLSQHPDRQAPRPPFIQVPDGAGGWREARAFMGFPGGKTKTIAVDVSDIFPPGDYRLRIGTEAEIRWDEVFFTVDEPEVEFRQTTLPLRAAQLHYRGCSLPYPRSSAAEPERYDYARVDTAPRWPPLRGRFTRYGDVADLLTAWDDRMVVLGAGDEMTVEFAGGPPIPPGWKRDFILHSVGWDKDADIHTVYGQTVEPLPFRAMPSYPYPLDEYPRRPELDSYLREYQTREQSPAEFWHRLRPPAFLDGLPRPRSGS
ncbi:MAG: VCBS repeat-containing protein [Pirellulales bacterium]